MNELSYKDLSKSELNSLKEIYISSRVNSMSEIDLRKFAREIIEDQIKDTVGNAEEKEAWDEMKGHFLEDFYQIIKEVKSKGKNNERDHKQPEEIEFEKRLSLLKRQHQEEKLNSDMWDDE